MPKYKPPPNQAQEGDHEVSFPAPLVIPSPSRRTSQKYLAVLPGRKGGSLCCYCRDPILTTDDAQLIAKRMPAHSICAFGADAEGWAVLDAMEENAKASQFTAERLSNLPG